MAKPFVGRQAALMRLTDTLAGAQRGRAGLALVTGPAGMGKTTLLTRFAENAMATGARVGWATCWDAERAPALWPWAHALRTLIDQGLETLEAPDHEDGTVAQLRLFDKVGQLLVDAAHADGPVLLVLDDLHWADPSTLRLLGHIPSAWPTAPLMLVGAYRPEGTRTDLAGRTDADVISLDGLSHNEVGDLVTAIAGQKAAADWTLAVHERAGGHPFFTSELAYVVASGGTVAGVPVAVREVIARRLAQLTPRTAELLNIASVAGAEVRPEVLATACGLDSATVSELLAEGERAGLLLDGSFAHDLYREAIYHGLAPRQRLTMHQRVARALAYRHAQGAQIFPAEIAGHFAAAAPLSGPAPAIAWARAAALADRRHHAYGEAAAHLERAVKAITMADEPADLADLVDLRIDAAKARLRAGAPDAAREHLTTAWTHAEALRDPDRMGAVALSTAALGARFAMPRSDLIGLLERARAALDGSGSAKEARVTAALARELQHSVPSERPRARPLSEHAVALARALEDHATLATCLLARHDVLWTPGTAAERAGLATEIVMMAEDAGDDELRLEALLLLANAQLEGGSPAFRATLAGYLHAADQMGQPRYTYLAATRRAALALVDGDLATADRLIAEAATLGAQIGEPDTGNVRMSQRLELVRARGDPELLGETADEAVRHWVGVPAHAYAVAAGFRARSGDLDGARQALETVLALDDWRTDRSYLWSVYVGELATAAVALGDSELCADLYVELTPVADAAAVNGALVCFMGAHAHRLGVLAGALGRPEHARTWLTKALEAHRRLGARAWQAESHTELAALGGPDAAEHAEQAAALTTALGLGLSEPTTDDTMLTLVGELWTLRYGGRTAFVRDAKGLRDLAVLLSRPGADVHVLELTGSRLADHSSTQPVLDRAALTAYRRRLAEAGAQADAGAEGDDERTALRAQIREATAPGGAPRAIRPAEIERARKAVAGRIRDAIRHIRTALPDLGAHLDRYVRTGIHCRYEPPT